MTFAMGQICYLKRLAPLAHAFEPIAVHQVETLADTPFPDFYFLCRSVSETANGSPEPDKVATLSHSNVLKINLGSREVDYSLLQKSLQ